MFITLVIVHIFEVIQNRFLFAFQKFRLHNIMFGVLLVVVIVVCLAMLVLLTTHEEADDDDD